MTDIVLAGVSLAALKKQKAAIQKDAAKFIADGVEQVKDIVTEIVTAAEGDDVSDLAKQAQEVLENIALVSSVSGIEYYLPHYDEYGYKPAGLPMYRQLEDAEIDCYEVDELMGLLEDMEHQVRVWNTSTC